LTVDERLIAGIITTPHRQEYLARLLPIITPVADRVLIFNDLTYRGHWWNLERCLRATGEAAGDDRIMLVTTDDVIAPPDWWERWQMIHAEAQGDIYTFMARQRHLFSDENLARGWVKGIQPRGFYDHAMLFLGRPRIIDEALAWLESEGRALMPEARQKHLDVVIQDYLVHTGQPWVVTIPTLFDHVGERSVVGHGIGHSYRYVGDTL
jgi:hypothetical protein